VGYQCVDCVQSGRQQDRVQRKRYRGAGYGQRTVAGAMLSTRPVVTPVLVALNLLVYVITAVQAKSPMDNSASTLHQDGVLWPLAIDGSGQWWRLFTSGFLHYGLIHVAVNMFALWVLGRDMEMLLGKVRFTAVYLLSLFGGAVSVYLFDDPNRGTAGASGAIYGLLGGILVAVLRLRLNPAGAIGVIAINLVISVSLPNISLLGHLGGLAIGAVATAAMVYAPAKNKAAWQAAALVLLAVALTGLVLYRDSTLVSYCDTIQGELRCANASG
jgi:membrane associated rhomboid family serine protease